MDNQEELMYFFKSFEDFIHDLKNYMSLLGMNIQHYEKQYCKSGNSISTLKNNYESILNFVGNFETSLKEKKIVGPDVDECMIEEVLESVLTDSEAALVEKKIRVMKSVDEDVKTIYTDEGLLKRILSNLISNAIKYSDSYISIRIYADKDNVNISVFNSGTYIDHTLKNNILNRYYTVVDSKNPNGHGVGLDIVRQFSQVLNGTIEVNSMKTFGTEFIVSIKHNVENHIQLSFANDIEGSNNVISIKEAL